MYYCRKCGAKIPEGKEVCKSCGTPLYPAKEKQQNKKKPKKESNTKVVVTGILVGALSAVILVVAFILLCNMMLGALKSSVDEGEKQKTEQTNQDKKNQAEYDAYSRRLNSQKDLDFDIIIDL